MFKFKKYLLEQILFRSGLPELDTMMVLLALSPALLQTQPQPLVTIK
jgi:hypothetical protein